MTTGIRQGIQFENGLTMEIHPSQQAYYDLPLWAEYMVARSVWQEAHARYAAMAAFHRDKQTARSEMFEAEVNKSLLLVRLRQTPEHLAAFGW